MRIDAYNQVSMLYKATGKTQVKKTTATSGTEDKLEISQFGKDYQIAKAAVNSAPDVREDKVADIKARYEAGTYSVSASDLANKLAAKFDGGAI